MLICRRRVMVSRACALDIALYSEATAGGDPWMRWLFPVNSLRSRALLLARTPLVLVLDGDMLVHAALHARLAANDDRCGSCAPTDATDAVPDAWTSARTPLVPVPNMRMHSALACPARQRH